MPAPPQNARDVFLAALEKQSAAERAAFLDEACAGDLPLRHRVEALLAAHDAPGEFLGELPAPVVATSDDAPTSNPALPASHDLSTAAASPDPLGSMIGPYKLLQKLGEGGMGTVYLAQQEHPVKRRVALKVVRAEMTSSQALARFEQERQ